MGRDRSLVPEALAPSSRGPCRSEHVRWGRLSLDEVGALDTVSSWHSVPWVAGRPCQLVSPDSPWMRASVGSLVVFQAGHRERGFFVAPLVAKPDCAQQARPDNIACQIAGINSNRSI
eukprot:8295902-Pyramimonas_sp.AAC.1